MWEAYRPVNQEYAVQWWKQQRLCLSKVEGLEQAPKILSFDVYMCAPFLPPFSLSCSHTWTHQISKLKDITHSKNILIYVSEEKRV